ncbi:hypothetical protein PWT90_09417 [Aphanocladium album]|nr:hypothetical protein PWT90_09417 [Aphanocladium album]
MIAGKTPQGRMPSALRQKGPHVEKDQAMPEHGRISPASTIKLQDPQTGPSGSLSVDQFEHHIKEWSKQNEDRDAVYQMLLSSLKNANDEITELKMNLDTQNMARRQFQIQSQTLEAKTKDYEKKAAKNPYVIVLVDGDGANFRDSLLGDAEAGGSNAARRLKKQIEHNLRQTKLEYDIEVFARVYANFRGLGKALRQSGLVRYSDDVEKFARGFTNSRPGFDFIDVDYGKENADNKIKHLLKWHCMDERCKKIFLVACHDAGYVHDLRPLADENRDRIVLVETTPAELAFKNLGLSMTHFDDVFRDASLETRNLFPSAASSPVQSVSDPVLPATPPKMAAAVVEPQPERRGSAEQRPGSYAGVCGNNDNGGGGGGTIVIGKGKKRKPLVIELNEDDRRIDKKVLDVASRETKTSFNKKLGKARKGAFCNKHYLEGGCESGICSMEHEMMLTPEEVGVLRFRARTGPCTNGPVCMEVRCSRGHHCPLDPACPRRDCQFGHTKFGNMHLGPGKMKAVPSSKTTPANAQQTSHTLIIVPVYATMIWTRVSSGSDRMYALETCAAEQLPKPVIEDGRRDCNPPDVAQTPQDAAPEAPEDLKDDYFCERRPGIKLRVQGRGADNQGSAADVDRSVPSPAGQREARENSCRYGGQGEQNGQHCAHQKGIADPVELPQAAATCYALVRRLKEQELQDERDATERQVEPKHPPPVSARGDGAAHHGPDGDAHAKHRQENTVVLAPLAHAHQVAHDDEGECGEAGAAEALYQPPDNKRSCRGRAAADAGA